MKPINPLELKEAVDRSASNSHGLLEEKLIVASDSFNNKKLDKITLSSAEEIHWVNVEQIVRCQSFKNYSDVYMDGSKKITVTKTLKEIEELLPKDVFFRAHQSHLINLHYVDKYVKRDGGYIKMKDDSIIDLARRRKEAFFENIDNLT